MKSEAVLSVYMLGNERRNDGNNGMTHAMGIGHIVGSYANLGSQMKSCCNKDHCCFERPG